MTEAGIVRGRKDIAKSLNTSERSAVRWAKDLGLPVQRVGTRPGGAVFAHESDLREWLDKVGTRLVGRAERQVDEAMVGPVSDPGTALTDAPRAKRRVLWIVAAVAAGLSAIALLTAVLQWRPSPPAGVARTARSPKVERTVTLHVAVPGSAAATIVVTDGRRATLAVPGRPTIELGAKVGGNRLELEVIGPDSAGRNAVLFSSMMAPGTRVGVKRPYRFDIEWPQSEANSPPASPSPPRPSRSGVSR